MKTTFYVLLLCIHLSGIPCRWMFLTDVTYNAAKFKNLVCEYFITTFFWEEQWRKRFHEISSQYILYLEEELNYLVSNATQVDFTCAQLRALYTTKNCAELCAIWEQLRAISYNCAIARNGIAIVNPRLNILRLQINNVCWHRFL